MNRMLLTSFLVALLTSACNKGGSAGDHAEEGGHADEGHAEEAGHGEGEHENEVHLSAEALERAGIRVAAAERRALTRHSHERSERVIDRHAIPF